MLTESGLKQSLQKRPDGPGSVPAALAHRKPVSVSDPLSGGDDEKIIPPAQTSCGAGARFAKR